MININSELKNKIDKITKKYQDKEKSISKKLAKLTSKYDDLQYELNMLKMSYDNLIMDVTDEYKTKTRERITKELLNEV